MFLTQGIFFRILTASHSPVGGTLRAGKGTLDDPGRYAYRVQAMKFSGHSTMQNIVAEVKMSVLGNR